MSKPPTSFLNGTIRNFSIYNCKLNAQQVRELTSRIAGRKMPAKWKLRISQNLYVLFSPGLKHTTHKLIPAVWWSPERTHVRVWPFLLTVPRRWWPNKEDGVRKCNNCGREVWMTGPPNMWCADCKLTNHQVQNLIGGPLWWSDEVRRVLEAFKDKRLEEWD